MPKKNNTQSNNTIPGLEIPGGEIVLYQAPEGDMRLDVWLEQETVWLSLNQMADLFERDKSVISRHLKNIFTSEELDRTSVAAFFAPTVADGKNGSD